MNRICKASIIAAALLLCLTARAVCAGPETEDYSVTNYELTIETRANSADARVTMDITYQINSGAKATGFKYIGNYEAEQLQGRDEAGNAIKAWVDHQRETRINWSFTPAGRGKKRIIVSFTIPGALANSADANEFEAIWAGIFRVVVKRAVYRFVFPDDAERTLITAPSTYSIKTLNGRRAIEITQAPLREASFRVTFWPRIVDNARVTTATAGRGSSSIPVIIGLGFFALIVAAIVTIARKIKRAATGQQSWWNSGSSCAGGSSCSSSCGSSCGGGCGGGCGG